MKIKSSIFFKIIALTLCFFMCIEQSSFAQVAAQIDISGHIAAFRNSITQDKFRPLHLRYLSYDPIQNNFRLLLDKGTLKNPRTNELENASKELLRYFLIGVSLPNNSFWVNLRPDGEDNVIDSLLAQTDIGKVLLEADVQLKKDTALATSPDTKEGKEYWDKLYRKAEEIFGSQNVTIPTLTRPWVVPGEIIIRETNDNAYIYKATLKVMLEEDYLKNSAVYNFKDERLKELNTYASQILREKIIPKLTQEVNTSKRYAALRQVYYSLILAQWFKQRFYGKGGLYSHLIDTKNLNGLTSKESWSKTTYFQQYQKSFKDGEYNFKLPVSTPFGQTIRSYFSGGVALGGCRPVSAFPPGQTAILEGGGSYLNTGASRERNIGRGVGGNDIPIGYDATNGKVTLEKLPIATGQSSQPSFTSPLPPASAPAATRGTLPENLLEAVRWIDSTDVVPGMEAVSVGPGTPRYLYLERKMQEAQSIPWEQFLVAKGVNVRVYEPKEEYNKSWRDDVAQWQGMEGKLKIEPTESARFEKNNFPDGSVDIITILSVLSDRSIPESVRKEIVLKAARALRQKGYLVIGWYDLVAGKKVSAEEEAETQSLLAWLQKETGYKLTPVTGGLETGQTAHRWVIYKINKPTPSVSGPAAASAPAAPGSAAGLQSRLQDTLRLIKEIAEEDSFKKSLEEYSAEKERLFGIYGEVAQIAKGIREIDSFDLVINPASGSDIKAGFSYGNNLVTIDRNNLFKVFLEFLAIGKKESLKEQLRGYLENKFYFGLHSSGRQVGFVEYAAELIAMGADLNSLEVISDQDIAGLHMTEVAFKVKGKQFTHTHFTYTFTGGAEDAKAVQSIKDVLVKKTNANVLLLSKAGSELSGKNEWLKSIDPLLPAGGMLVTDFSWSGVGLQDVTPQQKVANLGLSETRNYGYAHATQDLHFFEKKAGKDSRELAQTTSAPAAASTPTERASTALAKQMEREGKSREEILRETGYWRLGQDMQVSIDFSSLRLRPDALAVLRAKKASGQEAVLADIIEDGWEGVWLVPELTQTRVTIEPAPEGPVKYWGAMVYVAKDGALVIAFNKASAFNKDGMLSKGVGSRFIHEVSHALGHIKNYARGGNPANEEYMLTYAEYARVALQLRQLAKRNRLIFGEKGVVLESLVAAPIEDVIERWQADHHETVNPEAVEVAKSAATDAELVFAGSFRKDSVAADSRNYRLLQGEAVARMEQIRAAMTAQERQAEHPYNTLTRMLREERLLTKGQKPEDVLIYREHKPASAPAAQPEAKPGIEGPLLNDTMTKEEIYREVKRIITKNRPNAPDEVIYVVVKTARHFTSLLSEEDILMVYDRQLSEWHPGGGDWSKFFGQEGVSRKGFSADAVEKVRTILTDGRYRPEPSEAAGFSLEDIRAGAERVLEKDELVSFKFLETIDKLERILPYLYEMVRKIITEDLLKYDKIIILGRDAEIFYDALKAVLIGRPEAEKITLLPASKNFLINLNSRTTKQDREEFLTSHGLNEGTLKNGKTLLIDTGYVGSAGQLLIEVMQRLYMISDIWQRVHIKLVAIYPGATGVVPANLVINQMILTDPGEDTLNKEFPKSNRPRIVRGVNFTVADAIQALPHFYHRPYALERSSDGKLVVISSPVLDDMTSDIDRPNDVNVDNDNPVLAMIIQRRVVEYFNARRQELLATPAVASAPAAQPAGQAQKDKKTNLIHVMAGTEELPDDYKARFARAINETPAQYLDRLRNSEYEIEVIIADNPRQLKEYAEMVGFRDDVGNAFGYNNNGQAQVYVLKGHERDANVMSHEAIEAMGRQAIDDVDSAGAETGEENRLSPSASNQELLESAHSLAEFLVSEYPQVAEDGSLNYYIAGSLGVMLLLQAENIEVLEEGALPSISVRQIIPVTSSVRSSLTQFIRQIGDFDYVPLEQYRKIPLRQNNRLAKGGNERLQFAKMPEKVRRAFKKTDSRSMMSDPLTTLAYNPVRVIINGREFYITSPLVLAGYKFLHLLNNKVFDKPEKLTSDLKILLEAAGELHSRKEIIEFIHNILINYNLPYPNSEVAFFNHLSLKGQIEKLYKEVINSDPNAPYLESLSWVKERYSGILKVLQRLKNPDSKAKLVAFLNRNRKHIDIWFAPAESRNLGLIADLILESEDLRREIEIGSPGTLKDLVLNKASLLEFLKRNPWIWYKYSDRLPKESLDYLPGRSELLDILMEIEENNIDEELSVLGKIFRPDKVEYELRNVLKMRDGGDVRLRRQIVHMMAEGLAKLDREALIRLADALSNQIVRHSDKAIGGTLVAISLEEKKTYLDKVRKDFGLEVAYTSVPTAQPVGAQTDRGAFDLDKELNGLGLNSEVIYALNVAQENGGYLYHAGVEGIAARGSETGDFNQGYPLKPEPGKLIKARSFSVAVSSGYVGDALNDPYKASSLYYWDRGSKEWEQHRNPALYRIPIQAIVNLLKERKIWIESGTENHGPLFELEIRGHIPVGLVEIYQPETIGKAGKKRISSNGQKELTRLEIATGGPRIREIRKEIGLGPVTQKGIIWNKISTNRVVSITKEVNNIVKALESVRKDRLTEIIKPYMGQATDSEIGHVAEAYSRSLKAAEGDVKLKALISNSFAIALFIHSGERRKGGNAPSYIVHPADMAKDIADNPMGSAKDTVNAICEAWLHDTIEDAQLGFWGQEVLRYNPKADLAAEVRAIIRNKTNYQILKDLDTLTRRYTVTETEKKYFTRIKNGSKLAKRVKFADLKNNFSHFMEVEEDEFPQNFFDNHTQPFIFDFIKDAPVTDEAKIGLLRIMLPQSLHPKLKVSDRQRKSIIDAIAALENELPAPAAQITRLSKMHADSAEISKTINVLKDNGWRRSWLVYRILAQIYAESVLYYLWHLFDNQKGNPVYEVGVCAVIQDYLRKEFGLMPDDVAFIREKFVILGPDNKSGYMYVWTDITVLGVNIGDMRMLGTEITDWDTQAKHVIIKMRIDKDAINKILDAFLERINQPKPNLDRFDQPPSQSEKERFIDDTEVKFGQKLGDWRYEGNDPNAIIEKGTGQRAFRKPAILGQRVGRFKVANGTVKSAVPASAPAVTSAQPAEGKAVVVATQGGPDALASAAALSDSRLREQVERAIGFGRVFVTGMGEIIVQEGKKYRFISEISETDHERTLNQVKARRLQIAVAQSRNDPSEGEVAKALREDNRSAVEGFGSYTVADRDIPGIEKELFERISAAVSRGNLDRLLQDGNNIFERKYRFVGKDGREQAYTQRIMGSVEGGGFRIFHAPAAQVPEILAYLSRLWGKINDKDEMNIEQKKKALAEYEWWFFQCNPSGRAGASLGDAMSMIAQIALGIELRREYIHQDLIALSSTLENYVAGRAKEFQVPETRAAPIDKTGGIDGSTDSPSIPKKSEGPGGIDFRGLPIVTQPMPKPLGGDPSLRSGLPLVAVPNIKLDKEWGEIENMLNGGIIPSIDRIKDYLALSCKSEDCQARIDKALSCIAGILRIEEERCSVTDAALKQLLVLLESDKSANELQLSLAKIEVLAKEPALIGQ